MKAVRTVQKVTKTVEVDEEAFTLTFTRAEVNALYELVNCAPNPLINPDSLWCGEGRIDSVVFDALEKVL